MPIRFVLKISVLKGIGIEAVFGRSSQFGCKKKGEMYLATPDLVSGNKSSLKIKRRKFWSLRLDPPSGPRFWRDTTTGDPWWSIPELKWRASCRLRHQPGITTNTVFFSFLFWGQRFDWANQRSERLKDTIWCRLTCFNDIVICIRSLWW